MWIAFETSEEAEVVYNALLKYSESTELEECDNQYRVHTFIHGLSFTDCGYGLLVTLPTVNAYGGESHGEQPAVSVDLHFYNVHIVKFCGMKS